MMRPGVCVCCLQACESFEKLLKLNGRRKLTLRTVGCQAVRTSLNIDSPTMSSSPWAVSVSQRQSCCFRLKIFAATLVYVL